VLVNYGEGRAFDLLQLAGEITHSVKQRFGVELRMEPRLYPA
jgi:UDP-N-acetylmuramate dehydrogenase